jgi:hypothetical protein
MLIKFKAGDTPVTFYRNWFTGSSEVRAAGRALTLRSVLDPTTHFSFSLTRATKCMVGNHEIVIEQTRPLFLAGARPHRYRILVDGEVVARRHGY